MAHKQLDALTLSVKVFSPKKTYFDGPALALSAANETGFFDILPLHHNFITLVKPCDVVIKIDETRSISLAVEQSLLYATNDAVTIFLDV